MKYLVVYIVFHLLIFCNVVSQAQWVQTNGPYGGIVFSLAVNGDKIFAGTAGGGVYLSTNNGTNWTRINNGLTNGYIHALAVSGTNIFTGTEDGVFLSTNNGTNWAQVGLPTSIIITLVASGTNIFAGTEGGVYLSTNNGTYWKQVINDPINPNILSLAANGKNVYAGTYYGMLLSTNNGTNWTPINNDLSNSKVYALSVSGTNIFAGTRTGVYLSTNNGISWTQVNNGLDFSVVNCLLVSGTNIFAGTVGGGVWMRPLSELTSVSKEVKDLPQDYTLFQNYPNPFNPTTTISYRLKETGFVKLKVYDTKGALIKVLVNQTKEPGYYETEFNAKGLASGIYFYRIEVLGTGNIPVYTDMKKIVLLK